MLQSLEFSDAIGISWQYSFHLFFMTNKDQKLLKESAFSVLSKYSLLGAKYGSAL